MGYTKHIQTKIIKTRHSVDFCIGITTNGLLESLIDVPRNAIVEDVNISENGKFICIDFVEEKTDGEDNHGGENMKHAKDCIKNSEDRLTKIKEYEERWPEYCRSCEASGGHVIYGGRDEPDDFDLCMVCQDNEIAHCPRCAIEWTDIIQNEALPCPACGWNWGKGTDDISPCEPECYCNPADAPSP